MMVAVVDRRPMPQPRSARQFPYSRGCPHAGGSSTPQRLLMAGHHPGVVRPVNWFTAPRPAAAAAPAAATVAPAGPRRGR